MTDHHMDKRFDEESLNQACLGLKASVNRFLRKQEKKRPVKSSAKQDALDAVNHACHLLRQLSCKRTSLWHGICELSLSWKKNYIKELQSSQDWLTVLSRFFQHYLRLRDGKVLLTSGERRHYGDMAKSKYPSQLSTLALQSDGYTKLYSAPKGYSGFGWDEFFQEQVGIQARIVNALQEISSKRNIWEILCEYGAESFESALDLHEASIGRAMGELEKLRQTFIQDVSQLSKTRGGGGKVQMVTLDKMERLEVVFGKTKMKLERLGDQFKVTDNKGVLPNGWTEQEWSRAFKLPIQKKKNTGEKAPLQKRRRIVDSDDEDDSSNEDLPQKQGGLKVQVSKKKEARTDEASLDAIKTRLGVDAAGLQASREVAEAEEKIAVTTEANEETHGLLTDIAESRDKIKRLRRVLKRAVEVQEDEYEIWDVRECLRESIMSVGSMLLVLHSTGDHEKQTRGTHVEEAEQLFREAVGLVEQQEAAHKAFSQRSSMEESSMIERNLLLLRGRAHTNLGISLVERGLLMAKRKVLLNRAMEELNKARACAVAMRGKASQDAKSELSHSDAALDIIRASQLECLVARWLGSAMWHLGQRVEAKNEFESAAKMILQSADHGAVHHRAELEDNLLLGVECFYAAATLTEVASGALEQLPTASCADEKTGQDLFSLACRGYDLATSVASAVQKLTLHKSSHLSFDDLQAEHEILTVEQIARDMNELKKWWDQKKARAAAGTSIQSRDHDHTLPRSDLFADGSRRSEKIPRRGYIVTGGPSRRSAKPKRGMGASGSFRGLGRGSSRSFPEANSNKSLNDFDDNPFGGASFVNNRDSSEVPMQFRKWGDELLPQLPDGSGVELIYPACAPEPPNISSH